MVDTDPAVAPARPGHENVPSEAAVVEQTVVVVVSFRTVTAWPAVKPEPVTSIDPPDAPVGGSTRTCGLAGAVATAGVVGRCPTTGASAATTRAMPYHRRFVPIVPPPRLVPPRCVRGPGSTRTVPAPPAWDTRVRGQ